MEKRPVWSETYCFGIATIDQQHRDLFRLFCELLDTIEDDPDQEKITACFTGLYEHVVHHFEYEESLMRQWGFPGLLDHLQIHTDIRHDLSALLSIYRETFESEVKLGIPLKVATFMQEWLEEHMDHNDREYAVYLLGRGYVDGRRRGTEHPG
jgi:hemerythrin